MSDYYEWSGHEDVAEWDKDVEGLLIWWGTRFDTGHSETCKDSNQMHCCWGDPKKQSKQGLQSSAPPWDNPPVWFIPNVDEEYEPWEDRPWNAVLLEPGDRIYYRGNGLFELEKA